MPPSPLDATPPLGRSLKGPDSAFGGLSGDGRSVKGEPRLREGVPAPVVVTATMRDGVALPQRGLLARAGVRPPLLRLIVCMAPKTREGLSSVGLGSGE